MLGRSETKMGQGAGQVQEKDASEIRGEIEDTRAEMGETVGALAGKADVKTRTKEVVAEKKDAVQSRLSGSAKGVAERAKRAGGGARGAAGKAGQNPLALGLGAAALGFLAGLVAPSTRAEKEKIRPVAEQVTERAKETGQEALERGKQVAGEAAAAAKETAKERGREEQRAMAESVKEKAQQGARS